MVSVTTKLYHFYQYFNGKIWLDMKPKNIIYFGSPDFSATILQSLLSPHDYPVVGVVTSPDTPLGRKQIMTPSPVAQMATEYDLPIFKPEKLDDAHLSHLGLLKPDIFLVVSYGKFIPAAYLAAPTIGTFNIHFSLLPKYRGALPISEAIKNGDTQTGVTLMVMDTKMDHGPIISAQKVTIDIDDNVADLTTKLTQAAISLLNNKLPQITTNNYELPSSPQDDSLATYTPSLKTNTRQNAFIPWEEVVGAIRKSPKNAIAIHNLIRSKNPEPGAWTRIPVGARRDAPDIVGAHHDAPTSTGEIEIKILKTSFSILNSQFSIDIVQLPGKSPISWQSFLSGHQVV
jgi:methionyl-tRNA formyltransferase